MIDIFIGVTMKKIVLLSFFILLLTCIFSLSGCSSENDAMTIPSSELSKLPEGFPLESCPLYFTEEIVSVTNKGSESYFSYEIVFNSSAEYQTLVDLYSERFPSAIEKDFGIAYNLLSVPASGSGYMCNFNIYSDLTKGEKGICTVVVTVSEY